MKYGNAWSWDPQSPSDLAYPRRRHGVGDSRPKSGQARRVNAGANGRASGVQPQCSGSRTAARTSGCSRVATRVTDCRFSGCPPSGKDRGRPASERRLRRETARRQCLHGSRGGHSRRDRRGSATGSGNVTGTKVLDPACAEDALESVHKLRDSSGGQSRMLCRYTPARRSFRATRPRVTATRSFPSQRQCEHGTDGGSCDGHALGPSVLPEDGGSSSIQSGVNPPSMTRRLAT